MKHGQISNTSTSSQRNPPWADLCLTLAARSTFLSYTLCLKVLCELWTPRGGSTQTGLALKYVLRKGFPGGRNSSAAAQIAILLSDGKSQGNVMQAASQLKEMGVVLFAVGLRYPKYVCFSPQTIILSTPSFLSSLPAFSKKNHFQVGRAPRLGQWADGKPRLLRWTFLRCHQWPVYHTVHLLCLQCHTSRWETSGTTAHATPMECSLAPLNISD